MFTLRSVGKKQAKISVAGGSFDGGKPLTLKLGKKVTLVNSATGVRYELKLVYTGSQPEVIEGFTTTPDATSGSTTRAPPLTPRPQRLANDRPRRPSPVERRQVDASVRVQRYQRPGRVAHG